MQNVVLSHCVPYQFPEQPLEERRLETSTAPVPQTEMMAPGPENTLVGQWGTRGPW